MPALLPIQNPPTKGSYMGFTTLYRPEADAEVPVVVGYDIDGYKQLCIQSVHTDFGGGEWGADIQNELAELQVDELANQLCLQIDWRPRDARDLPNYAPHPMHV